MLKDVSILEVIKTNRCRHISRQQVCFYTLEMSSSPNELSSVKCLYFSNKLKQFLQAVLSNV